MNRSRLRRRGIAALAPIVSVLLAGCAASSPSPSPSAAVSSAPSASVGPSATASEPASVAPSATPTTPASAEVSESLVPFACVPSVTISRTTERAQITDLRVGTHAGYDRVTFEFTGGVPQTVVEGVLPPFFSDPGGQPLEVSGTAFLKVTMNGGTKVAPDGSVTYAGSTNIQPGFPRVVQLIEGGDFEAISTWYIGLQGGGCYRVLALAGPDRLAIDIEH